MILDLFIYIIQFYINQNTFLPGFIIRKRIYKLNGLCEYNYYLFSPNAAAKIDAHADKAVENNKWWGNDKGYYFTNTKSATTSLLNKEDGHDVREEIKVYESARMK